MIIVIESPSGKRKWKLEPFDNGLCWRLMKTPMDPKAKQEWVNCECYMPTLDGALEQMFNRMLCDPDDPTVLEFPAADVKKAAMKVLKDHLRDCKMDIEKED